MVVEARETLSEDRLYLDTCSSFHMCFNAKHLAEVTRLMVQLKGDCNAGTTRSREKGWLAGLFHMWLVKNGIANVLSVGQLEKDGFKISYETGGDWVVRTPNGKSLKFKRDTGMCYGFPYLDLRKTHDLEGLACVQTMRENFEGFTKRELKRAILARQKQQQVGIPSEAEFARMVSGNHVKNATFTVQDISNARAIYGPLLENTRGKTVRRKPERVEVMRVDHDFHKINRFVTLTADVMFVNGNKFLVTLSRRIRLFTAEFILTSTAAQLSSSIKKIVNLYARAGFVVNAI